MGAIHLRRCPGSARSWRRSDRRRDSRATRLGAAFLLIASSFAYRPALVLEAGLEAEAAAVARVIRHLPSDAFLPLLVWLFVRDFPRTYSQFSRYVAALAISLSAATGGFLIAANALLLSPGPAELPMLQLFDWPDAMQGVGARQQSTVAPQALAMLNSPFVRQRAAELAQRVRGDEKLPVEQQVRQAYLITVGRPATDADLQRSLAFIQRQRAARGTGADTGALALRDFCHLLLCTNEFLFVD